MECISLSIPKSIRVVIKDNDSVKCKYYVINSFLMLVLYNSKKSTFMRSIQKCWSKPLQKLQEVTKCGEASCIKLSNVYGSVMKLS